MDAAAANSFAVLSREREVVRLGHETLRKGRIPAATIVRAVNCIQRFKNIAEACHAENIVAVATASVREARNKREFLAEVEKKTGVHAEVLSGIEEARLIGLAASHGCSLAGATNINIDIGGGSTEISVFRDGSAVSLYSVRVGAVRLTERYINYDPPKTKELSNLKSEVRAAFERPARELKNVKWQRASGTSGTILAIAASLRSNNAKPNKNQAAAPTETEIPLSQLARLNVELAGMSVGERRALKGISSQRSEIIVAGGFILEGAMSALGINVISTCDWALREGVIIDQLREWEDEARPPVPEFADQKLRGVHAVGRRFGYEETHARQVAKLAEKIFDSIAIADNLTRHHRTLMLAGALLHDIGYHIAHDSHQKHALYLITNSELTGFSEAERAVIANIARYHRGSLPKERHPEFAALNDADRDSVRKLGAIVRLADALDRSHDSRITDLICRAAPGGLDIQICSEVECDNELSEVERKRDMFEQAFQKTLTFTFQQRKLKRA